MDGIRLTLNPGTAGGDSGADAPVVGLWKPGSARSRANSESSIGSGNASSGGSSSGEYGRKCNRKKSKRKSKKKHKHKKEKKSKRNKVKHDAASHSDVDENAAAAVEARVALEEKRRSAGLDWFGSAGDFAEYCKPKPLPSLTAEEQRRAREAAEAAAVLEDEMSRGLRDPVSKRPYGLFDPKQQNTNTALRATTGVDSNSISSVSTKPGSSSGNSINTGIDTTTSNSGGFVSSSASFNFGTSDPNKLAAKAMRAKITGNTQLYDQIQAEIARIKNSSTAINTSNIISNPGTNKQDDGIEVIAPLDAAGRYLRSLTRAPTEVHSTNVDLRKRKRGVYRDKELEAVERGMSVAEMARREKEGRNMDEAFALNVLAQGRRYKQASHSKTGADEECEDNLMARETAMFTSKRSKMNDARCAEADRQRAVSAHLAAKKAESSSPFLFGGAKFQNQLVAAVGKHCYIMLPPLSSSLAPGHVRIIPLETVSSMATAADEVVVEAERFQRALEQMCMHSSASNDCSVLPRSFVYLETVVDPKRMGWHTCLECVPLEESDAKNVPMFFKQALMEAGDEWANARHKLIDTSGKRISQCIPSGFAYFHVQWGGGGFKGGAYAHLIDDPRNFSKDFGPGVVRGLTGQTSARLGGRRQDRESLAQQQARVAEFKREWQHFDFTV